MFLQSLDSVLKSHGTVGTVALTARPLWIVPTFTVPLAQYMLYLSFIFRIRHIFESGNVVVQ